MAKYRMTLVFKLKICDWARIFYFIYEELSKKAPPLQRGDELR